jgi:uncharacterized protein (DUF1778 family)
MEEKMYEKLRCSIEQATEHARTTKLSERDYDRFLEMLEEDEPNENLKKAMKRCNKMFTDND